MGLELARKAQALKFQGGNTPSTLVPMIVPGIVPNIVSARALSFQLLFLYHGCKEQLHMPGRLLLLRPSAVFLIEVLDQRRIPVVPSFPNCAEIRQHLKPEAHTDLSPET